MNEVLKKGEIVAGRYEVIRKIGAGGFAVVYQVRQAGQVTSYALKTLLDEAPSDARPERRFKIEADVLSRLRHPNTVHFVEFGHLDSGQPFYVMEYLEGITLSRHMKKAGPMAPDRVWALAIQMLGALDEAHQLGVMHRDIAPDNIFICSVPGVLMHAKLIDLGIARVFGEGSWTLDGESLTREGFVVGKPAYMAPEYLKGIRPGKPEPREDLYSLGMTLAAALNGDCVIDQSLPQLAILKQVVLPAPIPLPERVLGSPLGAVIRKATLKAPEQRYQSAREMLDDLMELEQELGARVQLSGGMRRWASHPVQPAATARKTKPRLGEKLRKRYELLEELASSATLTVYRALDRELGREVRVEVLNPNPADYDRSRARFFRAQQILGALQHPATIRLMDWGDTDAGLPFNVLEHQPGETLAQRLARAPMSDEELAYLALQLLGALDEAHASEMIHRNIKPGNVLLLDGPGRFSAVKLLGFGLAKGVGGGDVDLTAGPEALGTVHYMSPEQARGARDIGPATDVYALGLTLAKARVRGPLFPPKMAPVNVLKAQYVAEPLPFSPEVDRAIRKGALGAVIDRAIQKDLKARYASAGEMLEDLESKLRLVSQDIYGQKTQILRVTASPQTTDPEEGAAQQQAEKERYEEAWRDGHKQGVEQGYARCQEENKGKTAPAASPPAPAADPEQLRLKILRSMLRKLLVRRVGRLSREQKASVYEWDDSEELEELLNSLLDVTDKATILARVFG